MITLVPAVRPEFFQVLLIGSSSTPKKLKTNGSWTPTSSFAKVFDNGHNVTVKNHKVAE